MASSSTRFYLRLATVSFVVLFSIVIALLMWLSRSYHMQFDWTKSGRNSLSPASISLLQKLDKPLTIVAFARDNGDLRKNISEIIGHYQKYKHDLKLEFVNPDREPGRTRDAGVQFDGELVVDYGGNKETVTQPSEENITNALAHLARGGKKWIVFLTGHGERSIERQANFDLSQWAQQLRRHGLKPRSLLLSDNPQIPQNTAVLVIAGPRVKLLPGEIKQISDYLDHGGSLLWLADPGPQFGLEPIAEMLGVEFLPGVIVDPTSQMLTGNDPTFIVVGNYNSHHPVVRGLTLMTLFASATGIKVIPEKTWQSAVILDTNATAWTETGSLKEPIRFKPGQDIRGPLNLGVSFAREYEKRPQRIAVFGDGDFLSNSFLANGANLDLGMNLINWLSHDDIYINMPSRIAPDTTLNLSKTASAVIAIVFLFGLPLLLLSAGVIIWWYRRRQ